MVNRGSMFAGDGSLLLDHHVPSRHQHLAQLSTKVFSSLAIYVYTKPLDGTEDETRRSVWGSRHVGWLLGLGRRATRPRAYRQLITLRTDVSHVIKKHCARLGTSSFSGRLLTLFFPLLSQSCVFPNSFERNHYGSQGSW